VVLQGFASGDLDQDAAALRMFTRAGETAVLGTTHLCPDLPLPSELDAHLLGIEPGSICAQIGAAQLAQHHMHVQAGAAHTIDCPPCHATHWLVSMVQYCSLPGCGVQVKSYCWLRATPRTWACMGSVSEH
jgi:hypothetical protein